MRKLPPYSRPLFNLISSGNAPLNSINLWIGLNAWRKGTVFSKSYPSRTIVLPPWQDPASYYFPVNECNILIHDTSGAELDYIDDLVACLYQDGADIVRYVAPDHNLIIFHKE